MGAFAIGDVVLIAFPYADFSRVKKRPALVVGEAEFDNLIMCQITSKAETSRRTVSLHNADFNFGTLRVDSFIRYDKLFTVEPTVVLGKVGIINNGKLKLVRAKIRSLFD